MNRPIDRPRPTDRPTDLPTYLPTYVPIKEMNTACGEGYSYLPPMVTGPSQDKKKIW